LDFLLLNYLWPDFDVALKVKMREVNQLKVSIVILNYNGKYFLKECLDSVFKQSYNNYQVIFIDNASTDGSVEFVKNRYAQMIISKRLKIMVNNKNYGFSKGNNIAIKEVLKDREVKYIVTLNNDTIVDRNFLIKLIECAKRNKKAGSVMPKMIWSLNPRLIDSAGILYSKNTLPFARGRFEPVEKYNKEEEIFGCCAGACLYKREALEAIALDGEFFDEDFFCYCEDVDLAFRLRWAGFKSYFCPDAIVYHYGSKTWGVTSDPIIYHTLRNNSWVMFKNLPKDFILKNLHWIIISEIAKPLFNLIVRQKKPAIKAKVNAYKNLYKILKKRKMIKRITNFEEIEKFFIMKWLEKRYYLSKHG